jgi:hypothetical protein
MLEEIVKVLKIPVDALKNFNEEVALINIQNNYKKSAFNANKQKIISVQLYPLKNDVII